MATRESKSARTIAIAVLNSYNPKRDYASQILNEQLGQTQQRQRATDLVFGTIRNAAAIDMVVAGLADCPVERIPVGVLNVIRIGA